MPTRVPACSPSFPITKLFPPALLVAFSVAVSATGCCPSKPDASYCDATGCYTCDRNDCSHGRGRYGGAGSGAPSTSPSASTPAKAPVCASNTECGSGRTCRASTCETCGGSAGPCPCAQDAECGGGAICQNRACIPKANVCRFGSDCADGSECRNGACVAACETGSCAPGSTCNSGACIPDVTGKACTSDNNCPATTPRCVSERCTEACSSDETCGAGRYCNQGACSPDTRPKSNCESDAQCMGGPNPQRCVAGLCKYTCSTDTLCRSIDNRIGYCGKDQVCRNAAEAAPACTRQTDCKTNQACVNNTCT
jgi:hypothetical protein